MVSFLVKFRSEYKKIKISQSKKSFKKLKLIYASFFKKPLFWRSNYLNVRTLHLKSLTLHFFWKFMKDCFLKWISEKWFEIVLLSELWSFIFFVQLFFTLILETGQLKGNERKLKIKQLKKNFNFSWINKVSL